MNFKRTNPLLVSAKILLLTLAFSVATISCSDDDDDNSPEPQQTVLDIAIANDNFDVLEAAAVKAGSAVTNVLDGNGPITVFAPTDAAFMTYLGVANEAAAITAVNGLTPAAAADLLTFHVISGSEIKAEDIATGSSSATTLSGPIYLSKGTAGVFINGTSQVTTADIQASNGVIHIINRTLVEPTKTIKQIAVDYTTASPAQFTQLVAALAKVPALLNAADAPGNLTVFAPTDAAFQALYTALGVANINELEAEIGNDKLAQVLQHHIVGARVFSTDLTTGNVNTLNAGDAVTINVPNLTVTDASGSTPPAALVPSLLNVHATNGVIHVIDKVLIPTGIL